MGKLDSVETETKKDNIVNSWNEWGPLKHVILGKADNVMIPPIEPALDAKIPEDGEMRDLAGQPRSEKDVKKANKQLDNFAKILRNHGVKVDRPDTLDYSQPISTPDWENDSMFGCMPARDVLLTVGNEILEATMSYRCRWFDYLCYRDLLNSYFDSDPNMQMEAAPKPRLTKESYKSDYKERASTEQKQLELVNNRDFVTTEVEPLFDAADVMRCGRDLFVQHGMTTNLKAIEWLDQHFPEHRVHAVNFPGDPYPMHIDATLVPLRPGIAINNPERPLPEEQRKIFEVNDWKILDAAEPAHEEPPPLCYSSVWLSMNVVVLDDETVCVEASEENQINQLKSLGFEVIPVPFRDAYAFGGGLHCATADVYREGKLEDYFPKQVEGF